MPVTLQVAGMKYKDGNVYKSVDCLKGDSADISIFAPDYADLSFPVAAGKLCTHDDGLYRANQAIAASESWTAAHWTATTVENAINQKLGLQNIGSGLNATTDAITGKTTVNTDVQRSDNTVIGTFYTNAGTGEFIIPE